jgi:CBS domain-containing membrane protein
MVQQTHPQTHPTLGDLPEQVRGLARRFRVTSLESRHHNRAVIGVYVLINSAVSIAILSGIAAATGEPFVFPSLGPTAFLLFFAAMSASASPRNVFCGHLIGVLAGFSALAIFGLTSVAADLEEVSPARIGAVTVALCLTLSIMVFVGVPHAPAGATTLIVALGLMRTPAQLAILMLAVVLLIAQGLVINRLAGMPYPLWKSAANE